jgi:hypothetical protein
VDCASNTTSSDLSLAYLYALGLVIMDNGPGNSASRGSVSDEGAFVSHWRQGLVVLSKYMYMYPLALEGAVVYGWIGQQSGSGFCDRPPATLGVFASLDRF